MIAPRRARIPLADLSETQRYLSLMIDFFTALDRLRILVVGDVMLDRYLQGSVSRISPEAPVPVVRLDRSWSSPGGAGHVAACLAGLGCRTTVLGLVGTDPAAAELRSVLASAGVAESELIESDSPTARTVTKTRVLAGDAQQMLRMDEEADPDVWAEAAALIGARAVDRICEFDAVMIADYEKGALPAEVIRRIIDAATAAGRPTVVDPKKADLSVYSGCTILTPNTLEAERAAGRRLLDDADVAATARDIRRQYSLGTMLITRGSQGMTGADERGVFHVPARVREVADVTGAGDTVAAVLAAALAACIAVREGVELAALAAGIAVSHHGTYVVGKAELRAAALRVPTKVLQIDEAVSAVRREKSRGRRVVFTNGCFDLLHAGHLHSLQSARAEGDYLVVGLNADSSIREIKGPTRPVVPEDQRAALLAGLACVDAVVLFSEHTPERLIRELEPDVLVKGGEYANEVVGAGLVKANGGRVVLVPRIDGLSTTEVIERLGRLT